MKKRKIPLRKSVVSNEMFPKKELLRITRSKEGDVAIDPSGRMPGRGAYIAIDRVFETTLSDEFYQELVDYVAHQKARQELFANE